MNLIKLEWLTNRIKKNLKKIKPLAKQWNTDCYRIYDKDIPEIPYQIDRLGSEYWIIEKGLRSDKFDTSLKDENYDIIKACLKNIFDCIDSNLWWQTRQDQSISLHTAEQVNDYKEIFIQEGSAKLLLKLGLYRDTGLFLDHRPLRLQLAKLKSTPCLKVLNLFCYTSSFSVHLALNGHYTTNIDLSNTYLDWSRQNFEVNKLDFTNHQFIQADILKWFDTTKNLQETFDLIILDPPSFSNSKRMGNDLLDIQEDHVDLIHQCMKLLKKENGMLYFSTNLRSFKLSLSEIEKDYEVENITLRTIPADFRDPKIHQCYKIYFKQR